MSRSWRIISIMTLILLIGFSLLNSKNPLISSAEGDGFERIVDSLGIYVEKVFNNVYNYVMN